MAAKSDPVAVARDAAHRIVAALDGVRLEIVRAKDACDEIDRRAVSADIANARLAEFCDRLEADSAARFDVSQFMSPRYRMPGSSDVQALTANVLAELIREAMKARLAQAYRNGPGLTHAGREEALSAASDGLLRLELAEEGIIREAERAGLDILRRANADPRAVLAPSEILS